MEYRTLDINIMSAKDLNRVNLISPMDVYVVVSIDGGADKSNQKKKTPVDNNGGTNPTWNFPVKFTLDESAARQNRLTLVFKLRCERALGDRDIGEVRVPVKELLDSPAAADGKMQFVSYQVRKPSGKPKGQLSFSYKFGDKISGASAAKADEPVTAYPVGPSSVYPPPSMAAPPPPTQKYDAGYPPPTHGVPPPLAYPYPPPPAGYGYQAPPPYGGYAQPPPSGYGYPPPSGYAYPPGVQPGKPPRKNNFGMGLGAGLLGGALGGLLIGDMVSDAGGYDAGYDSGLADGGGFDGGFDF